RPALLQPPRVGALDDGPAPAPGDHGAPRDGAAGVLEQPCRHARRGSMMPHRDTHDGAHTEGDRHMRYNLISGDNHIDLTYLPPDVWSSQAPAKWKLLCPRVEELEDG